nr:MAG TPA: hypothetical protein [Caudoviricetes sp.]
MIVATSQHHGVTKRYPVEKIYTLSQMRRH